MTRICDELVDKGWLRRNADEFYERTLTNTEKAVLQRLLTQFSAGLAAEL